jgi:metal-responsive CopG/Arc/MetJ family transcriptional regulator
MRINAVLYDDLIRRMDSVAREEGISRSRLIREATERYLDDRERRKAEELRRKKIAKAVKIQDGLRARSGGWNGAAEIRKWRNLR